MRKTYLPEDFISITAAVALLAEGDHREHDDDRLRKQRIRERIGRAVRAGLLPEAKRRGVKCYVYGRLVAWAQNGWPGAFGELLPRGSAFGSMSATGPVGTLDAVGRATPTTLSECRAELGHVMGRVYTLEMQVKAAREEAESLRSDAAKWQKHCAKQRVNAQQTRPR